MNVVVNIDDSAFRRFEKAYARAAPLVATRALNRSGDEMNTKVRRGIAQAVGVPPGVVKSRLYLRRANRRDLSVRLSVYAKPVNPGRIGDTRQSTSGVSSPGRGWPSAFVYDPRTKRSGPGMRGGQKLPRVVLRREGKRRTPLEKIEIPLEPHAEAVTVVVARRQGKKFADDFARELNFALRHEGRRY